MSEGDHQDVRQLDKLAVALAKAQGDFPAVQKSGQNPHLKNQYATLDDIITAVRGPLAKNGLSFVQLLNQNGTDDIRLTTILLHESGQSIECDVKVTAGEARGINAIQALGASITYMKRYSLGAMLGVATDTDADGEAAAKQEQKPKAQPKPQAAPAPVETVEQAVKTLMNGVNKSTSGYYKAAAHLRNAIRLEFGNEEWDWPSVDDRDAWNDAYKLAVSHAKKQAA